MLPYLSLAPTFDRRCKHNLSTCTLVWLQRVRASVCALCMYCACVHRGYAYTIHVVFSYRPLFAARSTLQLHRLLRRSRAWRSSQGVSKWSEAQTRRFACWRSNNTSFLCPRRLPTWSKRTRGKEGKEGKEMERVAKDRTE